jgi:colicin import membrane protein
LGVVVDYDKEGHGWKRARVITQAGQACTELERGAAAAAENAAAAAAKAVAEKAAAAAAKAAAEKAAAVAEQVAAEQAAEELLAEDEMLSDALTEPSDSEGQHV